MPKLTKKDRRKDGLTDPNYRKAWLLKMQDCKSEELFTQGKHIIKLRSKYN